MLIESPFLALIFLTGSSILTGITTALQRLGRLQSKEEFKNSSSLFFGSRFFYLEKNWDGLLPVLSFSKHVLQLCYAITAFFSLIAKYPFARAVAALGPEGHKLDSLWALGLAGVIVLCFLIANFLMSLFATMSPKSFFRLLSPIASFFLLLCYPLTLIFVRNPKPTAFSAEASAAASSLKVRDKILEILHEPELSSYLDTHDQKLILSVATFKERIAREVMVPRIDIFSLSAETSIQEAAQSFLREGYSRIPVYKENVDHIIGVLLYKEVLNTYIRNSPSELNMPIESLLKPVLYSPETKKISHLLQEFRSKQIHLAIVVDEYGGTEGIVTIEDILEELVGEIADEYDIDEEQLYSSLPTGEWIVDAKMSILDVEEELGIRIPQSPEYDTIGGYIFHRAGAIPSRGWRIHHDAFDLEVLSSNERSIEKVRITPHENV